MLRLNRSALRKIEETAQKTPGCISFSQGVCRLGGVSQTIKAHVQGLLNTDIADYYQLGVGIQALREKLATTLSARFNTPLSVQNILVSHGSLGCLNTLGKTLLDVGDQVLIPAPAYPMYKQLIASMHAEPIFVTAYHWQQQGTGGTWRFDIDALQNAITPKTKMILLSNPSNPTGVVLTKAEVLALKALCEQRGIYLVLDEIYDDFMFEGEFYSGTGFVLESEWVMRVGSFSKNYGMSGWRVGYLVAPAALISAMIPIQEVSLCCPSVIGQHAALFALDHPELVVQTHQKLLPIKNMVCETFNIIAQSGLISFAPPQAGLYVFAKTAYADSTPFVIDLLEKAKVAVVPGSDFGRDAAPFFRLCFAREMDVVREGMNRLQAYVAADPGALAKSGQQTCSNR